MMTASGADLSPGGSAMSRFANASGQMLPFGVDDATGLAMFGDSVPIGGGTFVFTLGTGVYHLGCAH
jgi:flavin-dependent dehydrogenase